MATPRTNRHPKAPLIAPALLLALGVAATLAHAQAAVGSRAAALLKVQSRETMLRLANEGVVLLEPEAEDGSIEGLVMFDLPIEETWALLIQGDRQDEYRDDLESVETVGTHDGGPIDEHRIKIMFVQLAYRLRYELNQEHWQIRWGLDPEFDNGLEEASGSWRLYELESGRTLGHFGTRVRVGAALPSWIQDSVTRTRVPDTLQRCRVWVDSRGHASD